jgi:hypothetical protein
MPSPGVCAFVHRVRPAFRAGLLCVLVACQSGSSGDHSPSPSVADGTGTFLTTDRLAASAVELTLDGQTDSLDLSAVGRLIGDARVVMLSEPWLGAVERWRAA